MMKLTKKLEIDLLKINLRSFKLVVYCFKKNPSISQLSWGTLFEESNGWLKSYSNDIQVY
jgi:hypothetical protein